MKMKIRIRFLELTARLVVVVLLGFVGFIPYKTATADTINAPVVTTTQDVFVNCTSTVQLCDPPFSTAVVTGGLLQIEYLVPQAHCSSIRLHVFVDGNFVQTTGFLGWYGALPPFDALPLTTGLLDLGHVSTGEHTIRLQAEGQLAGCNIGYLGNWAGTLIVHTSADADVDGIPDSQDACSNSDLSPTVVINGRNSGVFNTLFPTGCTISDHITACVEGAKNHGQFVGCVSQLTNDWVKTGTITGQQKGAIQRSAAQSSIP